MNNDCQYPNGAASASEAAFDITAAAPAKAAAAAEVVIVGCDRRMEPLTT